MAIIEPMTPEEEVRLRLAAGISPSTSTEYMLRHIPLWVKMSILRRNAGIGGGDTEGITTFNFTSNTYQENGRTVSLGDISEFIRLSSATKWQDSKLVEVANNVPRISGEGLLIEPQGTNLVHDSGDLSKWYLYQVDDTITVSEVSNTAMGRAWEVSTENYSGSYSHGSKVVSGMLGPVSRSPVVRTTYVETQDMELLTIGTRTANPMGYYGLVNLNTMEQVDAMGATIRARALGEGRLRIDHFHTMVQDRLAIRPGGNGSVIIIGTQAEMGVAPTSYIPTSGTPATRTPDILNIPLLPTQTITGDWDEGVTYEIMDNIAIFTGHGYIRNITVEAL